MRIPRVAPTVATSPSPLMKELRVFHSPDRYPRADRSPHHWAWASTERDLLRRALRALVAAPASRIESDATAESRERLAVTGERAVWAAQDAAHHAFVRQVGAYARALRDRGVASRQVLAAVDAVVRDEAAASLDAGPLAALVHDAGRCCVEAYYAR